MAAKASIKLSEQRRLHAKSGNRCALCRIVLVEVGKSAQRMYRGKCAYIYGEKPGAARYDSAKSDEFVNSEWNLIFLCRNCHKKVDTEVEKYPPEKLLTKKAHHEEWVVQKLAEQSTVYSYAEIEVLAKYLLENNDSPSTTNDYTLLKIEDKIEKNHLSDVQRWVKIGLSGVDTIEDYINRNPDANFGKRLTAVMASRYKQLKNQNLPPIDIFYSLWDIASGNSNDFNYNAAGVGAITPSENYKAVGLGILVYFFEKCEAFEK